MAVLSTISCLFCDVLVVILVLAITLYGYMKYSFRYWKKRGVGYIDPKFPFGNFQNPLMAKGHIAEHMQGLYEVLKQQGHKHAGTYSFTTPFYLPIDPDYIKNVISKDFHHFVNRGFYHNEKSDPLSAHLFAIEGQKWRNLRHMLTPTFTSGKMKMMFHILVQCSKELDRAMNVKTDAVDIKNTLSNFTMDVIGNCAFGIDCNSFTNPDSEFVRHGRRAVSQTKQEKLKIALSFAFPNLTRKLGMTITPKEVSDFYLKVVKETVKYREENNFVRKDFMEILIDLKNNTKTNSDQEVNGVASNLTINQIAAQAFVFFLAGFETSSTTMTFCLFELALNPEMQQRVRDEVNSVLERHSGEITYEGIQEMKYMEQAIEETLRKYPPLPVLNRKCNERYNVPGTDVVIEEGVSVLIPVLAIHRDPEHYPDPEKFDPERFSEENKKQRHPFTYLPFGEGPRICIGLRFGVMQSKVGLAVLLKNYKFTLNKKTQVPLKMDPYSFVLSAVGGIWLDVTPV